MTTATHTIPSYRQQAAVKSAKTSKENEAIFVPTLVDLQTSVKKGLKIFQLRRQMSALLESLISGVVSFR